MELLTSLIELYKMALSVTLGFTETHIGVLWVFDNSVKASKPGLLDFAWFHIMCLKAGKTE